MADDRPIGLFDSGVGGLTVVSEVFRSLPQESIVYFADTARYPYGGRAHAEISEIAAGLTAYLVRQSVKAIIVACNTSTSVALDRLRDLFPLPLVGMIEPGARAAVQATRNRRIGVIATDGTVASGAYVRALQHFCPEAIVVQQGCPELTDLVESGQVEGDAADTALRRYLAPLQAAGIDTLVLGCTHYPYLLPPIARLLGPGVALVDPAAAAVREMQAILARQDQLASGNQAPQMRYIASKNPAHLQTVGSRLLGQPIGAVELVPPAELTVPAVGQTQEQER